MPVLERARLRIHHMSVLGCHEPSLLAYLCTLLHISAANAEQNLTIDKYVGREAALLRASFKNTQMR